MVTRIFEPRQLVQGSVRIRNTGNTPATFGVRVSPGATGLLGFAPEVGSQTVITPTAVAPGDTVTLTVTIRLPETPGRKSFRVEAGETDLTGRIIRVIDTQDFANLAEIRGLAMLPAPPGMVPLPGEPAIPGIPELPLPDLAMEFQESLGQPTITFLELSRCQGEPFFGRFTVPTGASAPFSPELRISVVDNLRNVVNQINLGTINVPAGGTIDRSFNIPTADLPPGNYFGSLSLVDPVSGIVLLGPLQFPPTALMVLDCPPEVVPELPAAPALFGRPTISVFPFSVSAGEATTLRVRIPNTTPNALNPQLFGNITSGGTRVRSLPTISLSLDALQDVDRRIPIDTTGLAAGLYGFQIALRDPASGAILISPIDFPTGFQVEGVAAPTPAPAPTAPAPTPAIARGELQISYQGSDPRSPARGQRVRVVFNVRNTGPGRSGLQFSASMIDGGGRTRAGNLRTSAIIGPFGNSSIDFTFTIPDDVAPGFWNAQMLAWDPNTFVAGRPDTFIFNERISMFTIGPAFIEPEPPPPAPAPIPVIEPELAPGILRGQLTMTAPRGSPSTVGRNQIVQIEFTLQNRSDASGNLTILAFPVDSSGRTRGTLRSTVFITARGTASSALSFQVPEDSPSGAYSIQFLVWDPRTFVSGDPSTFLINEVFQQTFTVR